MKYKTKLLNMTVWIFKTGIGINIENVNNQLSVTRILLNLD
jgi:hypothetical protein